MSRIETSQASAHDPRVRESAYMHWLASTTCCVACLIEKGKINRQVQIAHLRVSSFAHGKAITGMQTKPSDRWSLPLCMPHHTGDVRVVRQHQHDTDELEWWERMGVDPFQLCLDLSDAFDDGRAGMPIIAKLAGECRRRRAGL